MGSKMRFLFLLGALLVLFAEVAYPQGEDYQGKRGKHGFLQGKRGKHGFFEKEDSQWPRCSSDNDCRPNCVCVHGMCDRCTMPKPDSREDYQGKRGKHGFIRDEEDPLIRVPLYRGTKDKLYGINMGVYDESNYNKDNPDDDYQGKRGKHGFLQGKREDAFCSSNADCGDGWCCGQFGICGRCTLPEFQGKNGKHGFLQGKRGKHGFVDGQGCPKNMVC